MDPYIVIYHDVMPATLLAELPEMIYHDELMSTDLFTLIAQKRLRKFADKFQRITGHSAELLSKWQPLRYASEKVLEGFRDTINAKNEKELDEFNGHFAISVYTFRYAEI